MFDQTLGLLDHHFGDLDVTRSGFVEGRRDDFALHAALHIGDFLGSLIDEQDQQKHLRVVVGDRLGHVLQQDGFAGTRRSDNQRTLALALRADQIDYAGRLVLDRRVLGIEVEPLVGIERSEVVEIGPVADRVRIVVIDLEQLGQRKITLAILGRANFAFDRIAGPQAPLADLIGRDVDVVRSGKVVCLRRTQEAETILQHLDRADTEDLLAIFRNLFQDREHQVLTTHRRCALDLVFLSHGDQLRRGSLL